jgi:eukaryotic-like serine/threonine-protein kinase
MIAEKLKSIGKRFLLHPLVKTPLTVMGIIVVIIVAFFIFLHVFTRHGQGFPVPDFTGLTKEEALAKATLSRLRYEVTDSVFIMTREPGIVIEQNPSAGTYVKPNRRVFVVVNALNPKLVETPNVVGVTLRQAKSRLEMQGFRIGALHFKPDLAVNTVLEQRFQSSRIAPGTLVPMGSRIDLLLGQGLANERTVLPRLVGLTYDEARNLLLYASLNMGKAAYDETVRTARDTLQAKVYSQYPMPHGSTSIAFGSRVDVHLTMNEQRIPREQVEARHSADSHLYSIPDEEVME